MQEEAWTAIRTSSREIASIDSMVVRATDGTVLKHALPVPRGNKTGAGGSEKMRLATSRTSWTDESPRKVLRSTLCLSCHSDACIQDATMKKFRLYEKECLGCRIKTSNFKFKSLHKRSGKPPVPPFLVRSTPLLLQLVHFSPRSIGPPRAFDSPKLAAPPVRSWSCTGSRPASRRPGRRSQAGPCLRRSTNGIANLAIEPNTGGSLERGGDLRFLPSERLGPVAQPQYCDRVVHGDELEDAVQLHAPARQHLQFGHASLTVGV